MKARIVAHAFNSSTLEEKEGDLCKFDASLIYTLSSRTARAKQYLVSKKEKEKKRHLLKTEMSLCINSLKSDRQLFVILLPVI